ncbi:hypothetical protein AB0J72_48720 [Dactylosporangium sp. NPDC049742]|uniref:hypothetical protein n=1 Tax=Dactylosporangium sp. NPDC049742 TaxID=3154737 RepID=UPI00342FCD26
MGNSIKTASGDVHFATCRYYYDTSQAALQRLADLHHRAVGEKGPFQTPVVNGFTEQDAFHAYSDASVALLAQLAVAGPSAQVAMLDEIATAADRMGTLDGLEGVFLSAARAAQYIGADAVLGNAADVFQALGLPGQLGGGALTSAILDAGTGLIGFVTGGDIGAALSVGTSGWLSSPSIGMSQLGIAGAGAGLAGLDLLFSGTLPGLAGLGGQGVGIGQGELGVGHTGPSSELTGDVAEGGLKLGGAIGTLVGGLVSGPGGAVFGGAMGGAAGYLIGWGVEKLDTPYVPPNPDAHTGTYGPYGPFIQPYIGANHGSTTATGTPIPPTPATGTTGGGTGSGGAGSGGTGSGGTPAGSEEKKTIKPGDSTKSPVDDGGGGSLNAANGPGWFPARAPYGAGMAAFSVWQREALLLIGLPAYDDEGTVHLDGYFPIESITTSGIPSHAVLRGRLISPTTERGRTAGGFATPRMLATGPSTKLTIPATVNGQTRYGLVESVRALFETMQKFQ